MSNWWITSECVVIEETSDSTPPFHWLFTCNSHTWLLCGIPSNALASVCLLVHSHLAQSDEKQQDTWFLLYILTWQSSPLPQSFSTSTFLSLSLFLSQSSSWHPMFGYILFHRSPDMQPQHNRLQNVMDTLVLTTLFSLYCISLKSLLSSHLL